MTFFLTKKKLQNISLIKPFLTQKNEFFGNIGKYRYDVVRFYHMAYGIECKLMTSVKVRNYSRNITSVKPLSY
jgi:hypothetical protein